MKLALLKGNRFNPWHLQVFKRLPGDADITAFRVESEVQHRFAQRDDGSAAFKVESLYFDTDAGNPLTRLRNRALRRFRGREARVLPFSERLKGFDLVQSWEMFTDWTAEALTARERHGVPLAVMIWDNIPFNMEQDPERRAIKQRAVKSADRFLVYTERSRRTLEIEGVAPERIRRLNPAVDTSLFCPGEGRRKALGLEDDDFVILFVGWLLERKGIDFLVLALHELLAAPEMAPRRVRLLIQGSGPGQDRVAALIQRLGVGDACRILSPTPYGEMPEVFRTADVFVLPSIATPGWQEQFGMSLIEAMACGVSAVCTLTGAVAEIAGDAGVLCQPNDFVALYEALLELALHPEKRREMSEAGRARAEEHFSIEGQAARLWQIYEEMLGSTG